MTSDAPVTIRLAEQYDVATASHIVADVRQALDAGARAIVVDMNSVVFMDSSALGSLIEAKRVAEGAGASMTLSEVPENTARLLSLTALDQVFVIASTRPDTDDTDDTETTGTD